MKIRRVDEQGYALSDEDMEHLSGSVLWLEMLKNRVIVQSIGFEQEIMNEITLTGYYHLEEIDSKSGYDHPTEPNVQEYIHRVWFQNLQDKENFMQILAMKKLGQDA